MSFDSKKPYGNNSFDSTGLFFNRNLYKNRSYPGDDVKPLDLWYERENYGKIDKNEDAIELSKDNLKVVSNGVRCVNFVADAFEQLLIYIFKSGNKNRIKTEESFYYNLTPRIGYVDADQEYLKYTSEVYGAFVEFSKDKKINESITNFDSFLKAFSEFVDRITPQFSFTKSGFMLSNRATPMISGLGIEFSTDSHADDKVKYETYIKDVNFQYFQVAAQKHGFVIDKNAPWRIFADLGSEPMREYMSRYEVSVDNVIDTMYNKVSMAEIDSMKEFLKRIYNLYVTSKPEVRIVTPVGEKLCSKTISRSSVNEDDVNSIDDFVWLKYYAYIRAKEIGFPWQQKTFNQLIKTARQLYKFKGYDAAHAFVVTNTKGVHREKDSLTKGEKYDTIRGDFHKQSTFQTFKLL